MDYKKLIDDYAEKYLKITEAEMFRKMLSLFACDLMLRTAHAIQEDTEQKECKHECISQCRRTGCNCLCGDAHEVTTNLK